MLKVGDKVVMNDKYHVSEQNKGKVFTIKAEPQEVCGTMSVWLEDFRGCYAVDGLTKVEKEKNMERPKKLNNFIYAILSEARRNSLVELCECFDISEQEMNECLEYLRAKEGMNIKDI